MDTSTPLVIQGLDFSFLCLLERLARGACVIHIIHYKQNIVLNKLRTQEHLNKHERQINTKLTISKQH